MTDGSIVGYVVLIVLEIVGTVLIEQEGILVYLYRHIVARPHVFLRLGGGKDSDRQVVI